MSNTLSAGRRSDHSRFESDVWQAVQSEAVDAGFVIEPRAEETIRGLTRAAGENLMQRRTGYRDRLLIATPQEYQEAEAAFMRLVTAMRAEATTRETQVFDAEIYEVAYARICPIFPICK